MALKTLVKINQVNNLSDARYCAGMGVDLMGFCLDPTNEQCVTPEKFNEITGWISGVKLVGEFNESNDLIIKEFVDSYALDYIQVARPDLINKVASINLPIILKVDRSKVSALDLRELLEKYQHDIAYFLLTSGEEIEDHPLNKEEIAELAARFPLLLGFGVNEGNVLEIISETKIAGIALQGGDEIKPGYKDFDALADVLEKIEIDDLA